MRGAHELRGQYPALRDAVPPDEGDLIIVNDSYFGGTHLMDVRMVKPFYCRGELWTYLSNTGHWSDTGGLCPAVSARPRPRFQQEGLRLPPVHLVRRGELIQDVVDVIMSNIRVPEERLGDMRAQLGALSIGEQRLTALLDKYGERTVSAVIAEMRKRSEALMHAHIEAMPHPDLTDTSSVSASVRPCRKHCMSATE